jgi:hypothetical protein
LNLLLNLDEMIKHEFHVVPSIYAIIVCHVHKKDDGKGEDFDDK